MSDDSFRWRLVADYFKTYGFVRHQITGFDSFVNQKLLAILKEKALIQVTSTDALETHTIDISNLHILKPRFSECDGSTAPLLPAEAKIRGLTYNISVMCDVEHKRTISLRLTTGLSSSSTRQLLRVTPISFNTTRVEGYDGVVQLRPPPPALDTSFLAICFVMDDVIVDATAYFPDDPSLKVGEKFVVKNEVHIRKRLHLFDVPCMVKSMHCHLLSTASRKTCPNDCGGYFIIGGHSKCLVSQLKLRINKIFVFDLRKKSNKYDFKAEVRSLNVEKWRSTSTLTVLMHAHAKSSFVVNIPFVGTKRSRSSASTNLLDIPLQTLIAALQEKADARLWIKEHSDSGSDIPINSEVLPHLGLTNNALVRNKKIAFLKHMRDRILETRAGRSSVSDRDHQANRRVDGPGPLLAILFRQLFRNNLKTKMLQLKKSIDAGKQVNLINFLRFKKITSGLRYHFSTGNWSLTKGVNTGVVQLLSTMSLPATRSHLNRISTPMNREGKSIVPRMLHVSAFGVLGPSETPEGQSCGLLNQKAMLAHVTSGLDKHETDMLVQFLLTAPALGIRPVSSGSLRTTKKHTLVCVGGDYVGYVETGRARAVVRTLRRYRMNQTIPIECGIVYDGVFNLLNIMVQPGRLIRPIVHTRRYAKFKASVGMEPRWKSFVENGAIIYVDKEEEQGMQVDGRFFDEVVASGMLSTTVASIPFADRNQAPRNIYQSSMGKQSISFHSLAQEHQLQVVHDFVLNYPQKPLLRTKFDRLVSDPELPTTQCAVVAIMIYGGWNQEDSLIVNKASIERGFGAATYFKVHTDEITARGTELETFEVPRSTSTTTYGSKENLDADGLPQLNSFLAGGACVIGKTAKIRNKDRIRDRSTYLKHDVYGRVDKVAISTTSEGKRRATVRIRRKLNIMEGDKLASVHGQKGTVGLILPQEDMPFSMRTGMTPDLIMSPHAIPSRMTIGQLLEMLGGKLKSTTGDDIDATAFNRLTVEQISRQLRRVGFNGHGTETFCSGRTGEVMECRVFVGPTSYQRLKHLAEMKRHSRATGSVAMLTRQPLEGRSRGGGLRFGEMERDSVVAHGASSVMLDRLLNCSDATRVKICKRCKSERVDTKDLCFNCGARDAHKCTLPFSFLLLKNELLAMGIKLDLNF